MWRWRYHAGRSPFWSCARKTGSLCLLALSAVAVAAWILTRGAIPAPPILNGAISHRVSISCAAASQNPAVHQLVRIRDGPRSFFQPTLDEAHDQFVSRVVNHHQVWDVHVAEVLQFVLDETPCNRSAQQGIIVDVGANIGYFSSTAASRGCDTHAFEPQGETSACVHVSACINGWAPGEQRAKGRLSVYRVPVSPHKTLSFPKLGPSAAGNTGGVSADFCLLNPDGCESQETVQLDVLFERLLRGKKAAAYGGGEEPILVLKTDIEGYDIEVSTCACSQSVRMLCKM